MTGRLLLWFSPLVALSLALVACSGGTGTSQEASQQRTTESTPAMPAAAPTPTGPQIIEVKAGERSSNDYYFEPKQIVVQPGVIRVRLVNEGPEREHTFSVKNKTGEDELVRSDRVAVGQTATIEFTIQEEGTYEFVCVLRGHADRGQRGTLVVRRAAQ